MISIKKSSPAPSQLATAGATHCAAMEIEYDQDPVACLAPKSTLIQARKSIYGPPAIKQVLKDDQYDKCCYCECEFTVNYHGDVEHFRPKAGYQQDYNGQLIQPGYFWLAYQWRNLYFACALCNQTYKGNFFPLANHPAGRADGHVRDTAGERALLIDLATEDPENHITFKRDVIEARKINGKRSIRGKACITAYGLDNVGLTDKRREFLARLISDCTLASLAYFDFSNISSENTEDKRLVMSLLRLHKTPAKLATHIKKAKKRVRVAAQDSAEFAGMVRAFVQKNPLFNTLIAQPSPALANAAWKRSYHL